MATGFEIPFERITFRDGQTLGARDLRDEDRLAARLRALHNRYVHGTWGVALGCEVALLPNHTGVLLQPGYAIDAAGRDVIIAEATSHRVPHTAATEILVLSATACGRIEWTAAHGFPVGAQVPLVSARASGGKIAGPLDFRVRRNADRMVRPRIGSGITAAGHTGWQDGQHWLETTVDTSDAGFTVTPQYLAFLTPASAPVIVTAAALDSFTCRVVLAASPFGTDIDAKRAEADNWTISWMGLENGGHS